MPCPLLRVTGRVSLYNSEVQYWKTHFPRVKPQSPIQVYSSYLQFLNPQSVENKMCSPNSSGSKT